MLQGPVKRTIHLDLTGVVEKPSCFAPKAILPFYSSCGTIIHGFIDRIWINPLVMAVCTLWLYRAGLELRLLSDLICWLSHCSANYAGAVMLFSLDAKLTWFFTGYVHTLA